MEMSMSVPAVAQSAKALQSRSPLAVSAPLCERVESVFVL